MASIHKEIIEFETRLSEKFWKRNLKKNWFGVLKGLNCLKKEEKLTTKLDQE